MNCARIYDYSLALRDPHSINNKLAFNLSAASPLKMHMPQWQTSLSMWSEDVTNGFFLYSLLLDKAEHGTILILPHDALKQRSRIEPALLARNHEMEGVGQELYLHACDLCFVVFDNDGIKSEFSPLSP